MECWEIIECNVYYYNWTHEVTKKLHLSFNSSLDWCAPCGSKFFLYKPSNLFVMLFIWIYGR
jgi:hypothetical protein